MIIDLSRKQALVCGASQGIGAATAEAMAKSGANITLLARNEGKLQALAEKLQVDYSIRADFISTDVNDLKKLESEVRSKLKKNGHYHILVNNSGGPAGGPILGTSAETFLTYMQNHVIAAQLLVNLLIDGMKEDQYGRVLNIISTSVKQPIPNLGASNTIRGAMASWAKTLSREVGENITVNNVLPGFTETERLHSLAEKAAEKQGKSKEEIFKLWKSQAPANRFAKAEEVAFAIAYLSSPLAAFINGISLPVDGGRLASL